MSIEFFNCEKHGKQQINVFRMGDFEFGRFCPLCIDERNADGIKKLNDSAAERKRAQYITYCEKCHIDPEFYDKKLSDYIPHNQMQKLALEAVSNMIATKSGKILLLGQNGVGKTMLASIAARELGGKIYTMYEISTRVRQTYTASARETELEVMDELTNEPFLAIDEFGRSKCSEAERNWLSHIVRVRHGHNRPFMLISNKHFNSLCPNGGCPDCIENYMDGDVFSRFRENSVFISINAPDFRGGRC